MHVRPYSLISAILFGPLLGACRDEAPTEPTAAAAVAAADSLVSLVGAPNSWEQVASAPSARYSTTAATAVNVNGRSILYVFGGASIDEGQPGLNTVENYNILSDHWGTKAGMPIGAGGINGAGNINGKLYLPGGSAYNGDGYNYYRELQVYDPAANSWALATDMPFAGSGGVAGVIDNRLYVLAGFEQEANPDGSPCNDCPTAASRRLVRYDPATNQWATLRAAPNFHIAGVAGVIKGKLYVTGGCRPGTGTRALDIYNPATNTWTSGASLPSVHSNGVGVVLGGLFYVIGGETGEVVAYNPTNNRWIRKASFPVPDARYMSGDKVVLNGKARIVVHVGYHNGNAPDIGRATYVYTP